MGDGEYVHMNPLGGFAGLELAAKPTQATVTPRFWEHIAGWQG
jgi:hypothetical protein